MKSLKLALAVLACAGTIDGAALANGAPYLSQSTAASAALRDARTFESYFNSTHPSLSLSTPRAYCTNGRDSATMFTCGEGWYLDDGSGDTIWAIQVVHVTLVNGRTKVRTVGHSCIMDRTTGVNSSGCP